VPNGSRAGKWCNDDYHVDLVVVVELTWGRRVSITSLASPSMMWSRALARFSELM
jgi:hypothetical protein